MDYQDRLNRIDRKRVGALNCRDAVLYYRYCEELGLPYDSLEAPDLFDEGLSLVEARQRSSKLENSSVENSDWKHLARVALARFSKLQIGESIGVREIKRRLGQIRQAGKRVGYEIISYSGMNKDEAWKYLMEIRAEISERMRE